MSAKLLDGRGLAAARERELAVRVEGLRAEGITPRLVVLISEAGRKGAYFRAKERIGARIGVAVKGIPFPHAGGLKETMERLSSDPSVSGIMVEAPLPPGIEPVAIRETLPPAKDVDCGGTVALGRLLCGEPAFPPATAEAVIALLTGHRIDPAGKNVIIVGRSLVVGRPLALLFLDRDATVTVCHSKTKDLAAHTRDADIVCVAAGRPRLVTGSMIRPGAVVVDVGTNRSPSGLVGDVDPESVASVAGWLSPVPGGVGPLTTTILMEHVVAAAERLNR